MKDKTVVIAGGATGIGYAAAKKMIEHGANVIILGRTEETLKSAVRNFGANASYCVCDISDLKSLKITAKKIKKETGGIDCFVNCAGIAREQKQGVLDEKIYDDLMRINLKGAYLCGMVFGYGLIKHGGAIVNIGSVRARTGTPSFSSAYAAAKAGVINLTKSLALELASKKIRVNCVAPGAIYPTNISRGWTKKVRQSIASGIPMKRLGKPEEVADAVYFLSSDMSAYITGQTIDINGGLWMN